MPPEQLMPTYELWTVRRESWLPPFPLDRRYDGDRDPTDPVRRVMEARAAFIPI